MKQAELFAKKADAALAAGRLIEAADAYRDARWLLPALPSDLPEHVTRVLGSARMRHADRIEDVTYNADGSLLVTASREGTVKVWDVGSGREVRAFHEPAEQVRTAVPTPNAFGRSVAVGISPDGKTIAFAAGKDIKLLQTETGKELFVLQGHTDYVTSVAFAPDGKTLGSGGADMQVRTWDVETGKPLRTFTGHSAKVECVAFSPDGKMIASTGDDGIVRISNTTSGNILLGIVVYKQEKLGGGFQVAFNPSSPSFASCGAGAPPRTNLAPSPDGQGADKSGALLQSFTGHAGLVTCLAFSKDGKFLATGGKDKSIRIWDAVNGGASLRNFHGHMEEVTGVAFHPSGQQVASVSADQTV